MATSLKLYVVDSNQNKSIKTVTNVNPSADDYILKDFSQRLMSLSNSAINRIERVDTKDITFATES